MPRLLLIAGLYVALSAQAFATDSQETAPTAEGVRAVEAHWTKAFLGGDGTYLAALLDDDYVSVNAKGVARPKAEIIALAKKIAATPAMPVTVPTPNIVVHGNAAISTSSNATSVSVDVFHYENGAWHAWYSQHTAIPPG
jgi:ketosteroid isomerase-like protein